MKIDRRLAQSAAVVGLAAMLAIPVLAQTNTNGNENATSNTNAPAEHGRKNKPALDPACVITAVDVRDTAVMAAWDAYAASVKAALTARKTALDAAWGMTDAKARRGAIRAAWKNYHNAVKTAKKTLRDAKRAAWKTFKVDSRKCGPGGGAEDGAQGMDSEL